MKIVFFFFHLGQRVILLQKLWKTFDIMDERKHLRALRSGGKTLRTRKLCSWEHSRQSVNPLAPVRFNEIFGLMAWIHRARIRVLSRTEEPTVQWSRYNERKYPRYANIGRVPDHLRRAGRKRVRKRRGAHVPSICIPPDAQFAYGEICIPRTHSRGWDESAFPAGRSKEIRVSVRPLHPHLVFS